MPLIQRGGFDIDQAREDKLSGGANAEQFLTTVDQLRPVGNVLVFDAYGNAINSGITLATLVSLLDVLVGDDGFPILDDDGNAISTP